MASPETNGDISLGIQEIDGISVITTPEGSEAFNQGKASLTSPLCSLALSVLPKNRFD